jgi:transcription initiation factor IIF auxiliary subunit
MDKLADNLQKLQEDDLLQVVQLIHDNKSQESYTKNDVEGTLITFPSSFHTFSRRYSLVHTDQSMFVHTSK